MARRKPPTAPDLGPVELPVRLRRGEVIVEDFVSPSEQPPSWWELNNANYNNIDSGWREIRALTRWQDAVEQWGAERGLSVRDLRRLHHWPGRPPPFAGSAKRRT